MVAAALVVGCGGGAASGAGPGTPGGSSGSGDDGSGAATPSGGGDVAWADMDRQQRMEFMGLQVLPAMKELFQEFDSGDYGDFRCQSCHGDDMESVDFKMPNALYELPKDDPIAAANEYNPEITAFMKDKVVPKMQELIGVDSCFSCHQEE